jgi:formylglycine-generating enzyme required for sulfatase activity
MKILLFTLLLCTSSWQTFSLPWGIIARGELEYISEVDGAQLVRIPAGVYEIGSDKGRYDEAPRVRVELSAFLIDREEVSNFQFAKFLAESGYKVQGPWKRGFPKGGGELSVRYVTFHDARAYTIWARRRLPTEAEWEAATGTGLFPWGSKPPRLTRQTDLYTLPLAPPNPSPPDISPFGVRDLGGSLREWTADWYDRFVYRTLSVKSIAQNPRGPASNSKPEQRFLDAKAGAGNERSTRKVVRGAGFFSRVEDHYRSSRRGAQNPDEWFNDIGFRCAVTLEP